jgi:hypothetical protein
MLIGIMMFLSFSDVYFTTILNLKLHYAILRYEAASGPASRPDVLA